MRKLLMIMLVSLIAYSAVGQPNVVIKPKINAQTLGGLTSDYFWQTDGTYTTNLGSGTNGYVPTFSGGNSVIWAAPTAATGIIGIDATNISNVKLITSIDTSYISFAHVHTEYMLNDIVNKLEKTGLYTTDSGDDRGLSIPDGQLSIGTPSEGKEAVFGEGDSYPVPIAYHCTTSDFSGTTVINATNVSTTLQADAESTTGMFGGTTIGDCILVGSDYPFGGVKVKITTAMTMNGGDLAGEYLKDNSPTWTNAAYMATDADFPYTQYGDVICNVDSTSEQIRFGFNPLDVPTAWDKVTLTVNGVSETKYWARFYITSTITTDAVIEQLKLHTNRWECNADGVTEYFGRSRYPKSISLIKTPNAAKNPANENITVSSGITMLKTDNEFSYTADDGLILQIPIPEGLDTGIPIQVDILWYPKGTSTGNVILEMDVVKAYGGMIMDGTNAIDVSLSETVTLTSGGYSAKQLMKTSYYFLVDDMLPEQGVIISLFRDGSSEPLDTYSSNIVIVNYVATGHFWR